MAASRARGDIGEIRRNRRGGNPSEVGPYPAVEGHETSPARPRDEGCSELLLTGVDDWQFDTTPFVYPGASGSAFDVNAAIGHDPWDEPGEDGAKYIWWSPNPHDLGRAIFTLDFFVE